MEPNVFPSCLNPRGRALTLPSAWLPRPALGEAAPGEAAPGACDLLSHCALMTLPTGRSGYRKARPLRFVSNQRKWRPKVSSLAKATPSAGGRPVPVLGTSGARWFWVTGRPWWAGAPAGWGAGSPVAPLLLIRRLRMYSAFRSFPEKKPAKATRSALGPSSGQRRLLRGHRGPSWGRLGKINSCIVCDRERKGRRHGPRGEGGPRGRLRSTGVQGPRRLLLSLLLTLAPTARGAGLPACLSVRGAQSPAPCPSPGSL